MKSIKLALLGGAALAVTAAAAHADDLDALKAQIEALNARVAAMEAAPAVPAGYSLLAISEGPLSQTPGLPMTNKQMAAYGNQATYISVLPTADAPAGATITWSGYARAGLVYYHYDDESKYELTATNSGNSFTFSEEDNGDDVDVLARGQLRVTASTDTAVGEVGVDIRLRANFDGNGAGDVYSDVAWGYWAMTPELTFGGGYAGSLGNIDYGYDGACTCYYTDNADVDFDPGDTTQLRLSYTSGPFSMAIALEDATVNDKWVGESGNKPDYNDQLGVAGEIKYSGDVVNGEISGVWRGRDTDRDYSFSYGVRTYGWEPDDLWQIGVGLGFALGDMASLSLAAAYGEGPFQSVAPNSSPAGGKITSSLPVNNSWWGMSALASANLSDAVHAEIGVGYKERELDKLNIVSLDALWEGSGDYNSFGVLGGIYFDPVDQLTLGVEAEYWTNETNYDLRNPINTLGNPLQYKADLDATSDNFQVDFVSVWRF